MKRYFFSFVAIKSGTSYFDNIIIEQKRKVQIKEVSEFIEKKNGFDKVVILFFKKLNRGEDM